MAISVNCRCGARFQVKDEHRGMPVRCPSCSQVLTVPGKDLSRFDVFISYSKHDQNVAQHVCATLEAQDIRCWIAPRDISAGKRWGEAVVDGIRSSRSMVLILSSAANVSDQVWREVERAASKGLPILPLRVENVEPARQLELYISGAHWLDAFEPPLAKHLWRLPESVRAMLAEKGRAVPPPPAEVGRTSAIPEPIAADGALLSRNYGSKLIFIPMAVVAAVLICLFSLVLLTGDGASSKTPDTSPAPVVRKPDHGDDPPAPVDTQDYDLGIQCLRRGDLDGAIRYLTRHIQKNPKHFDAYANRGLAYSRKGEFDRAITDFGKMVQLDPTNASGYSFRGQAYGNSGRHDMAVKDFTKAIALKPESSEAYNFRAQSFLKEKHYDRAVSDFSEYIRRKGGKTKAPDFVLPLRGRAYAKQGKHQEAVGDFAEAIRRNPRNAEAYYRRSLSYGLLGQSTQAKADRDKAKSLDDHIEKKVAGEGE